MASDLPETILPIEKIQKGEPAPFTGYLLERESLEQYENYRLYSEGRNNAPPDLGLHFSIGEVLITASLAFLLGYGARELILQGIKF